MNVFNKKLTIAYNKSFPFVKLSRKDLKINLGLLQGLSRALTLCIMCVQYRGGAHCHGGVQYHGEYCHGGVQYHGEYYEYHGGYLEYHGGVQYHGEIHEYRGDYLEYRGGVQYHGGYHPLKFEYRGGYHDTCGGIS